MNYKNSLILSTIFLSSNLIYSMENKQDLTIPKIKIDYSNINWGDAFNKLPSDIIKEILDYVFIIPNLEEFKNSKKYFAFMKNITSKTIGEIEKMWDLKRSNVIYELVKINNLKMVNKAFAKFILKNYSEQSKKISITLNPMLFQILDKSKNEINELDLLIAKELIQPKDDLNFQDIKIINMATALINASQKGYKEIVELLIKAKANLNLKDRYGFTAIMRAAQSEHKEIVELLLFAGADLSLTDNRGRTALEIAENIEIKNILQNAINKKRKLEN